MNILGSPAGPNSRVLVANTFNGLTRDFILSGPTTTLNSVTNFTPFGSSSALNLTLTGAVTPIKLVIAGKLVTISSALVCALTDANWNFVYFDKDTGALGTVTVAPRYWWEAPSHAAGQHWFDMSTGLMKLSDGASTWTAKNRIFLGCWRADTTIDAAYGSDKIGLTVIHRVNEFGSGVDGPIDTNNSNTTVDVLKKYSFIGQRGTSSLIISAAQLTGSPVVRVPSYFMNLGTGGVALNGLGRTGGVGGTGAGGGGGGASFGGNGGGGGGSAASAGGAGGAIATANVTGTLAGGTAGTSAAGTGGNGSTTRFLTSTGQYSAGIGPVGHGAGGGGGAGDGTAGGNGGAGGGGIDIHAASVTLASGATFTCNGANGTNGSSANRGSGGGGGGGRSRLRYGNLYDNNGSTFTATGGTGGSSQGANSGAGGNGGDGVFEKVRV